MAAGRTIFVLALAALAVSLYAQPPRPIKRPLNNQLAIEEKPASPSARADVPGAVAGATSQIVFHVSPLQSKGLLSKQTEEALKALDRANGNATFLKLRAFVAGNGDLRRVQGIVSEYFGAKKLPPPVVTTVQIGALTMQGAQIVIESISEDKKPVNINGLAFFPGQGGESGEAAVIALQAAMASTGAVPLVVTCFADSEAAAKAAAAALANLLPKTASVSVQATRYAAGARTTCEGIGQDGPVRSPKLVLTGTQLVFGEGPAGIQTALERMDRALESFGVRYTQAAQMGLYATRRDVADQAQALIKATPLLIEGLTSADATLAIEAAIPTN